MVEFSSTIKMVAQDLGAGGAEARAGVEVCVLQPKFSTSMWYKHAGRSGFASCQAVESCIIC